MSPVWRRLGAATSDFPSLPSPGTPARPTADMGGIPLPLLHPLLPGFLRPSEALAMLPAPSVVLAMAADAADTQPDRLLVALVSSPLLYP